eukprot:3215882-Amphidinium_carterae.1
MLGAAAFDFANLVMRDIATKSAVADGPVAQPSAGGRTNKSHPRPAAWLSHVIFIRTSETRCRRCLANPGILPQPPKCPKAMGNK